MTQPKRRWGDRIDGWLVRDNDPMHFFVPYLYPNRADSEAVVVEQVDLTALEAYLGDLNRVKRCVKILGFVASTDDFHEQAQVINSASQVFIDAFGEEGRHARSAIGSNALPLGLAVEVESIFEIEEA